MTAKDACPMKTDQKRRAWRLARAGLELPQIAERLGLEEPQLEEVMGLRKPEWVPSPAEIEKAKAELWRQHLRRKARERGPAVPPDGRPHYAPFPRP